jgi:hypothetical protein
MTELGDRLERLASTPVHTAAGSVFERARQRAEHLRRRRAQRRLVSVGTAVTAVAAVIVFAVVAPAHGHGLSVATRESSTTPQAAPTEYEVDATVLQRKPAPPELCIGIVADVALRLLTGPEIPDCSGPPINGWDWTGLAGATTNGDTSWGTFHVVGTFDGTTFTLTRRPTFSASISTSPLPDSGPFTTPCATPPGGWKIRDTSRFTLDDWKALDALARGQADFAGEWTDGSTSVDGVLHLAPEQVITFAFTGDVAAHQASLEAVWGGPICVVQRPHSRAALNEVASALQGSFGKQIGLDVIGVGQDDVRDQVFATVVVATPAMQDAVARRFGADVVRLEPLLLPVAP